MRFSISLVFGLLCASVPIARADTVESEVYFRVNSTVIDTTYMDNGNAVRDIRGLIRQLRADSTTEIREVTFSGTASPEGNNLQNHRLAQRRRETLEQLVLSGVDIPADIIDRCDNYIPWHRLKEEVLASNDSDKDEVASLIDSYLDDNAEESLDVSAELIGKLKMLNRGRTWRRLINNYFSRMRLAYVKIDTYTKPIPEPEPEPVPEPEPIPELVDTVAVVPEPAELPWQRRLYIKTNIVGWGMLITNIAAEADIVPHLSFEIPVYWSSWNYFTSTIKLRTLTLQPELRYWLKEKNDGFFAGAHFGMAWYNYAHDGDWRYQDHGGHTPALGGGISVGYRLPISDNNRWRLELSVGAGVYHLHYDKYHNTDRTSDGLQVDECRRTFLGIDRVSVTFAYTIGLTKKKEDAR